MENFRNIEVAESLLQTMSYFGIWRPKFLKSLWAIRIYTIYSAIVIFNTGYFGITFFIILYQNRDKPIIFPENIFSFTTICIISLKLAYLNIHRHDVNTLLNLFGQKHCLPYNNEEIIIHQKFCVKER